MLEDGSFVKGQFAQHVYCIVFDLMCRSEIVVAVNEIKDTLPHFHNHGSGKWVEVERSLQFGGTHF